MLKFTLYVFAAYALYYLIAIGYELLKSPKKAKIKKSTMYSVEGLADDESQQVPSVRLSAEASTAVEKKKD